MLKTKTIISRTSSISALQQLGDDQDKQVNDFLNENKISNTPVEGENKLVKISTTPFSIDSHAMGSIVVISTTITYTTNI